MKMYWYVVGSNLDGSPDPPKAVRNQADSMSKQTLHLDTTQLYELPGYVPAQVGTNTYSVFYIC